MPDLKVNTQTIILTANGLEIPVKRKMIVLDSTSRPNSVLSTKKIKKNLY